MKKNVDAKLLDLVDAYKRVPPRARRLMFHNAVEQPSGGAAGSGAEMKPAVLIAYERSGTIRRAFRKRGIEAWSNDLEPADDRSLFHLRMDAFDAIRSRPWALVIAHPVCRFLANSGSLRLYRGGKKTNGPDPDRWAAMRDAAINFRRLFFLGEHRGLLAVENPVMHGHAMDIIDPLSLAGVVRQVIQPYHFGDDASKATVLWLRGLPRLVETVYCRPRMACPECGHFNRYEAAFKGGCEVCGAEAGRLRPRWANQTVSGQNRLGPSEERAQLRAVTYPGVAEAMAIQWGDFLKDAVKKIVDTNPLPVQAFALWSSLSTFPCPSRPRFSGSAWTRHRGRWR